MKIGIIGGGAIGLLFSSYLSEKFEVTTLVRRQEQADQINSNGVTLKKDGRSATVASKSEVLAKSKMDFHLIIVAVKEYDLDHVMDILLKSDCRIPLLFLQNGIGHIGRVKNLPHLTLLAGSVEHGALKDSDHSVNHLGLGRTNLSIIRGEWGVVEELLVEHIKNFPFQIQDDYEEMLLKKLYVNVLINPLTAIAGVRNGRLPDNPHFQYLQQQLFEELHILYPQMRGRIHFQQIVDICHRTAENRSSMLKDIEENRKTEVETILGAILVKAQQENHFVPIMRTLYELVKGIEREGQGD
ncbi:2-dehydropantoate 2-reductase [Rossellomorea aquimaris]|uniref:2-dehydropantoate 2-reductase n=1 Tax=Rossellomorea aquimaris TaxID=189382 RepID=UPI001CD7B0BE|nr:2-dehydropantoate 2-reductase [Rossellomorea aquimaris]MCA1053410.1 2-dehydropantoate 2-reductase [Rossellomorea aquimaris]